MQLLLNYACHSFSETVLKLSIVRSLFLHFVDIPVKLHSSFEL